jgi:hypothetical protein
VYGPVVGIDVHKRQIAVAVRTADQRGKRRTQVRRFATFYAALREMTAWLVDEGVSHVAMESDPEVLVARLKRKIESLGYTVELSPAA